MLMQHNVEPGFEIWDLRMNFHFTMGSILKASSVLTWRRLTLMTHPGSQSGSIVTSCNKRGKHKWLQLGTHTVMMYDGALILLRKNDEDRETQAACSDQGEHSFITPAGSAGLFPQTEHLPGLAALFYRLRPPGLGEFTLLLLQH